MKKSINKILSSLLAFAICFSMIGYSISYAQENAPIDFSGDVSIKISDYLSKEDLDFIKDMEKIYPYFDFDAKGNLILTKSIDELKNEYGFDEVFISRLSAVLNSDLSRQISKSFNETSSISKESLKPALRRIHVKNWKVYFTYDDVMATLFAAAQVGPAAITAALTALGSAYPGVGTVLGAALGLFGGGTRVYWVLQAAANKQGLYIGIDWNGSFPNPAIGTW